MSVRIPFSRLAQAEWQRLADFGALVVLVSFLLYIGAEAYLSGGDDFRGYYAAARVVLQGGDPYDYEVLSRVLLDVDGFMGNNPYYYPLWWALMVIPLGWLPFQVARLVWIALTIVLFWWGSVLALETLEWNPHGWQRWLSMLSGAYLFLWLSIRSEQTGALTFWLLVLSVWAFRRNKPWLAGMALALLLTKPHITWLTVPVLGLVYLVRQPRSAWWALGTLAALVIVSSLVLPGWYTHLADPDFGAGTRYMLDGPDRIESARVSASLRDWLARWRVDGWAFWVVFGSMALACAVVLWMAWRSGATAVYLAALASALALALTPYAGQYDYPPLILALLWVYAAFPRRGTLVWWAAVVLLTAVFGVLLWEGPAYDGYWIVLGITALLLILEPRLWRTSMPQAVTDG